MSKEALLEPSGGSDELGMPLSKRSDIQGKVVYVGVENNDWELPDMKALGPNASQSEPKLSGLPHERISPKSISGLLNEGVGGGLSNV